MASGSSSPLNLAMQLEDFLGEWRDSMGNFVRVSRSESRKLGELDVVLRRSESSRGQGIRLTVKALDRGIFHCGHYELKLDESHLNRMVWGDMKANSKVSVWEREWQKERVRSRSRSRNESRCGCLCLGRVSLHCIDHTPRSVLYDVSTPEAWTPSTMEPKLLQPSGKPSLEVYDQILVQTAEAADSLQHHAREAILQEEKAKLLSAMHSLKVDSTEASQVTRRTPISSSTTRSQVDKLGEAEPLGALLAAKAKLLIKLQRKLESSSPSILENQTPKDPRIRCGSMAALVGGA